jgi:hypothetical protein
MPLRARRAPVELDGDFFLCRLVSAELDQLRLGFHQHQLLNAPWFWTKSGISGSFAAG